MRFIWNGNKWNGFKEIEIDFNKKNLSFDDILDNYQNIFGEIFLIGNIALSGVFRYQPTDGEGDYYFDPIRGSIAPDNTLLGAELRSLNVSWSKTNLNGIKIPPLNFNESNCWEADAVINVDGIWIKFNERGNGAYPLVYEIIHMENYRSCRN